MDSTHWFSLYLVICAPHFAYCTMSSVSDKRKPLRLKRNIYYLCGIFPDMYYSTEPCYYTERFCADGSSATGYNCINTEQCNELYERRAACIQGQCCIIPDDRISTISTTPGGYCPNGQVSQVRCSAPDQCDHGQICLNGLCCTKTEYDYRYPCGGITALASCAQRNCTGGAICTASKYCCECPVGLNGGECNQGNCPSGFTCYPNGYCCATCPNNATPYGACRNGVCGAGTTCSPGNICC